MNTAIIITAIICATIIIICAITMLAENKRRKEAKTIFDDIFKSKEDK